RGDERGPARHEPLQQVTVQRSEHQTGRDSDPLARVTRECPDDGGRDSGNHTDCDRSSKQARGRHLETSLTFTQMPAAPAARPTTSPTRTKTGAVPSTLSSATPPNSGSKTAAAREIPIPAMSAPLGPALGVGAMPLRILLRTRNAQKPAQPRCWNAQA